MMRAHVVAALLVLFGLTLTAQDEQFRFEVVSIRENTELGRGGSMAGPATAQWRATNRSGLLKNDRRLVPAARVRGLARPRSCARPAVAGTF
jgi:hypothetical protein